METIHEKHIFIDTTLASYQGLIPVPEPPKPTKYDAYPFTFVSYGTFTNHATSYFLLRKKSKLTL